MGTYGRGYAPSSPPPEPERLTPPPVNRHIGQYGVLIRGEITPAPRGYKIGHGERVWIRFENPATDHYEDSPWERILDSSEVVRLGVKMIADYYA